MTYTQYGPFTNTLPPAISQAFLNALETYLLTINSAATDSNITADGAGNITAIGRIQFLSGREQIKTHTGIVVLDASGNTDLLLNAPNSGGGHKIKLMVGGTAVLSIDQAGNVIYLNSINAGTP